MKKRLILGLFAVGCFVGYSTLTSMQKDGNDDEKKSWSCKHIDTQCPPGYGGGYSCTDGTKFDTDCDPSECNTITPCQPTGGGK